MHTTYDKSTQHFCVAPKDTTFKSLSTKYTNIATEERDWIEIEIEQPKTGTCVSARCCTADDKGWISAGITENTVKGCNFGVA